MASLAVQNRKGEGEMAQLKQVIHEGKVSPEYVTVLLKIVSSPHVAALKSLSVTEAAPLGRRRLRPAATVFHGVATSAALKSVLLKMFQPYQKSVGKKEAKWEDFVSEERKEKLLLKKEEKEEAKKDKVAAEEESDKSPAKPTPKKEKQPKAVGRGQEITKAECLDGIDFLLGKAADDAALLADFQAAFDGPDVEKVGPHTLARLYLVFQAMEDALAARAPLLPAVADDPPAPLTPQGDEAPDSQPHEGEDWPTDMSVDGSPSTEGSSDFSIDSLSLTATDDTFPISEQPATRAPALFIPVDPDAPYAGPPAATFGGLGDLAAEDWSPLILNPRAPAWVEEVPETPTLDGVDWRSDMSVEGFLSGEGSTCFDFDNLMATSQTLATIEKPATRAPTFFIAVDPDAPQAGPPATSFEGLGDSAAEEWSPLLLNPRAPAWVNAIYSRFEL
ncbi:hypothetical protein KFL_002560150 [Klebsormidium nitens]|uniref:Uncharacterized protein n=1 Tax=Klebsormidium nitens TaxID=105231 RepID=A0A0U9HK70_KLENI|nr:hypothetical protein KFL_002560150 [Klebsormidium nitens]|eukprot:GAQ85831.1 hypothetical protein KFL_002560150 [Klebsormidium nitens]